MKEAVLAQATGSFYQRPAAVWLQEKFTSTWIHRMDSTSAPPMVITSDATVDLQWIDGNLRVAGPDRTPQTETLVEDAVVVGLRFLPGAAAAWLGVPLTEVTNQRVALEDLWGARARRLSNRIRFHRNVEELARSVEESVAQEISRKIADVPMSAAFKLISEGVPYDQPLVPWLMRTLEMSERTLRRRFDDAFGYGPKILDRILRYQRFLKIAMRSQRPMAILAIEAGYSDQAHLIRESRRMTGSTPQQMRLFLQGG